MANIGKSVSAGAIHFRIETPGFDITTAAAAKGVKGARRLRKEESEALSVNEMKPVGRPLRLTASAPKTKARALKQFGSDEPHAVVVAPAPPGELLLLRVEKDGLVQWYVPQTVPQPAARAK